MHKIKELAKRNSICQKHVRGYRLRHNQPKWNEFIEKNQSFWEEAKGKRRNDSKILVATSVGGHLAGTTMESLLGVALTLRGAEVHFLLCDEALPACFASWIGYYKNPERFVEFGPKEDLCKDCYFPAQKMFNALGLPLHLYSHFLQPQDIINAKRLAYSIPYKDISSYKKDEIAVGEHALAGALRFHARGDLGFEPNDELVLRRYFHAAILTKEVMENLLEKYKYDCAVFHHGIYVPQGIIGEVCRKNGVRVVNWTPAYKKKTFIFSHESSYHHTMMTESKSVWDSISWDYSLDKMLEDYLKSRWKGTRDWIWFHEQPIFNIKEFADKNGIDLAKPCIGLLTSVMWDARLHYPSNAFPSMVEWVLATIKYFSNRQDLQLIIRIHPAEIRGTLPSRQPMIAEILKFYPDLPKNVFVILPEGSISTYTVMQQCNAVIIYNTKTGIELAAMGVPVIVAGEAWIKNKGFAIEASSRENYQAILDTLPLKEKVPQNSLLMAKKYAYHFFFRRMIPLEFMRPTGGDPPFKICADSILDFLPDKNLGLDIICNGILNRSDFVYPAESLVSAKSSFSGESSFPAQVS